MQEITCALFSFGTLPRQTMEETNKDPNFMAQADIDKKLEEKFKAGNQKLEEIQKVVEADSAFIVCNIMYEQHAAHAVEPASCTMRLVLQLWTRVHT